MWRRMLKATSGLAALLMVGCVELEVQNPNAPDAARALSTAGDVEALIGGAYDRWLYTQDYDGPTMFLSVAAGQHTAPYANAGMEYYGRIPRVPTANNPGHRDAGNLTYAWYNSYRAISAVRDGLKQIADGTVDLQANTVRAQAFGKYMQGLAHGAVAVLYDSGFVYDETIDPLTVTLKPYPDVITAALGYLNEAITLAGSASFTIPDTWMGQSVSSATLVQLAHSYRAILRASVARNPAERAAVDWAAVTADANAGVTADWDLVLDCNILRFCGGGSWIAIMYMVFPGWEMQNNWVAGMADQSGAYQAWITTPLLDKQPFIVQTPDTRWPQGADEATQAANPGEYYAVNEGDTRIWVRPDRGTWRWSYYTQMYEPFFTASLDGDGSLPEVTLREMRLLVAEAAYRGGQLGTAANIVNESRTLHGLNATDAGGTNTSCVPKLPNGSCGDLWEMLKWEKRLETQFAGLIRAGWYFDSRGWGDLMQGTILQLPVPFREMQLLEQAPYDLGGVGGVSAAPVGTYGY